VPQFLIFTFVVAMSLFFIIVNTAPPKFPEKIPFEILGLLGISGLSYVAAKRIQALRDNRLAEAEQASVSTGSTTESNGGGGIAIMPQAESGGVTVIPQGSGGVTVVPQGSGNGNRGSTVPTSETRGDSPITTLTMNNLQKGDFGEGVRQLQQRLNELGFYSGSINGHFDEQTELAVKAFQDSEGLAADGIAGLSTLKQLGLTSPGLEFS
jgi:hypothetical protein